MKSAPFKGPAMPRVAGAGEPDDGGSDHSMKRQHDGLYRRVTRERGQGIRATIPARLRTRSPSAITGPATR